VPSREWLIVAKRFRGKLGVIKNLYRLFRKGFPLRLALTSDIYDISELPSSTVFPHPYGITIGKGVCIGENCMICQNVTLGSRYLHGESGVPRLEKNVCVLTSAIVLGSVVIGEGAVIGAGSIVLSDVPKGMTVTGLWKKDKS
jgi:serine acetyltransferase